MKRIPVAVTGILFFSILSFSDLDLALQLSEEGDWAQCHVESRRLLLQSPSNDVARWLFAVATAHIATNTENAINALQSYVNAAPPEHLKASSSYQLGRLYWKANQRKNAIQHLSYTFVHAPDRYLYLHSACALFLIFREDTSLRRAFPHLVSQVNASRMLWYGRLFSECRPAGKSGDGGFFSWPGRWIVALYRSQVAPAIAMRCECVPSCSEYFRQACMKHGLLGFPMQADRFFREPSLVSAGENPITVNGLIKYADPVSDHDCWME